QDNSSALVPFCARVRFVYNARTRLRGFSARDTIQTAMLWDPEHFDYPGDVEMARLLADLACPRRLFECRALLRGAVAAQKAPLPSVLVRELFDGREPRFRNLAQADRFVASLFALMRDLQARFSEVAGADTVAAPVAYEATSDAAREREQQKRLSAWVGSLEDR